MLLFSTDIDGTVYDGPEAAAKFADFWNRTRRLATPPLLVYNTGRSLEDSLSLLGRTALPNPHYIISGVGTGIFDFAEKKVIDLWSLELSGKWNFETVGALVPDLLEGVKPQPPECQNPFKSSWFWRDRSGADLEGLRSALVAAGLEAQVVYSSARDLDIIPAKANKGNAVLWLSQFLEIPPGKIVIAGDSGNDASMFLLSGVSGVLVANAEKSLVEATAEVNPIRPRGSCAEGVIEALQELLDMPVAAPQR